MNKLRELEVVEYTIFSKFNWQPQITAEIAALQMAEAVFAGVEETQLEIQPKSYPLANLQKQVLTLQEALLQKGKIQNDAVLLKAQADLEQELELWRTALIKRDEEFTAFNLRTFCQQLEPELDIDFFTALAGFYRTLQPTAVVLSKFDYCITQVFSNKPENDRRDLRFSVKKTVDELYKLNAKWVGSEQQSAQDDSKVRESVAALAELSARAKAQKRLKTWLANNTFSNARRTKHELFETFFVPEVTAAVIVCNLVLGNHFTALCEADEAQLKDVAAIIAADRAANDALAKQLNRAFQILLYVSLEEDFAETAAQEQLTNLLGLTSDAGVLDNNKKQSKQAEGNQPIKATSSTSELKSNAKNTLESEKEISRSVSLENVLDAEVVVDASEVEAQTRPAISEAPFQRNASATPGVEAVLAELSRNKPNTELLIKYLRHSPVEAVRQLRLDAFLFYKSQNEIEANTLRRTLSLIVRAEDATRTIDDNESSVSPELLDETHLLGEEIQLVNNHLRRLMREASATKNNNEVEREYFDNLLYATNSLVEAQLRLNSSIVRRQIKQESQTTKNDLSLEPQPKPQVNKIKIDSATVIASETASLPRKNNLWILALAAVIVLCGGAWFLLNGKMSGAETVKTNYVRLEPDQLRGGAFITEARVSRETLFAYSNKDWETLPKEQKEENLRKLLEQGNELGYRNATLINSKGEVVANVSPNSLRIQ